MTRLMPLSQSYGCPTTRRYPRTLAEAFPYSDNSIEPIPDRRVGERAFTWALALLAVALVLAVVFRSAWLPGGGA